MSNDFFKGLLDWKTITGVDGGAYLVYGGDDSMTRAYGKIFAWRNLSDMLQEIFR